MKKLAVIASLVALASGAFAQGTVNFLNGSATLISYQPDATSAAVVLPSGAPRSYYFALLTAPLGTTDPTAFTFSGIYGTNLTTAGIAFGGNGRAVTGWTPGTSRSFYIAGWSVDQGVTWNPAWATAGGIQGLAGTPGGWFGRSAIGAGFAGGVDPVTGGPIPALNLFGASPSLTAGFTLVPVPEPTTMALAGLGAAALLIFRRRK